jgi:hypothetical protein
MVMAAVVTKFPGVSGDIVGGLRRLADRIEAEEFPDAQFVQALVVNYDASFTCLAFGPAKMLEVIGAMSRALANDLAVDNE